MPKKHEQLRIPLEYWEFGKDHYRIECPENLSRKKIESVFYFERKILPCSTQFARKDANGRRYTVSAKTHSFQEGDMFLDLVGYAWRILSKDVIHPITIPPGYKFHPKERMIIHPIEKKALFPIAGTKPKHAIVYLPDHPLYRPPKEYDRLGCPKSKGREYTKLTDKVKKEKEDFERERKKMPKREDSTWIDPRPLWRILLDFLISLFKRG